MDSKVFRMALLTIFSVFALIAVIVYATNADRINGLFGKNGNNSADSASTEASLTLPEEAYGEQIGDNLNGFLYDEDFFDEVEKVPSVVVIKKSAASSSIPEEAPNEASTRDETGTGMAVVGQLDNPDAEAGLDTSAAGVSLPAVIPIDAGASSGTK